MHNATKDDGEVAPDLLLFAAVRQEELACIKAAIADETTEADALGRGLFGLSLSGGGVRSASFSLGLLQSLARHRMLERVDYLSTVSGGGFAGGYLSRLVAHHARALETKQIAPSEPEAEPPTRNPLPPEALAHLRSYSNYLTPRLGLLSADFWTALSTHARNMLLNLCMLLPALACVLMLPWIVVLLCHLLVREVPSALLLSLAGALLLLGWRRFLADSFAPMLGDVAVQRLILMHVLLPALLLALAGSSHLGAQTVSLPWLVLSLAAVLGGLTFLWARFVRHRESAMVREFEVRNPRPTPARTGFAVFAASLVLTFLCGLSSRWLLGDTPTAWLPRTTGLGTICMLASVMIGGVVYVGIMGTQMREAERERWARAGAWCWIFGLAWLLLFVVAFVVPPILLHADTFLHRTLSAGWLAGSLTGALLGRSAQTGSPQSNRKLEQLVAITPYLFLIGLLSAVATALHWSLVGYAQLCVWSPDVCNWLKLDSCTATTTHSIEKIRYAEAHFVPAAGVIGLLSLLLALVTFLLSRYVDINVFSLNAFYRNRLVRCFLGAPRHAARRPDPLTGFDQGDDLPLDELSCRPFHLINTTLNLTGGGELAGQERKAASFTFSRLHAGYKDSIGNREAYRCTRDFGQAARRTDPTRLTLGAAIAISGAAASPNAGHHTSPALAFMMTVFNARLGFWLANPKGRRWTQGMPAHAAGFLLAELFGFANDRRDFVYLSDGGHFENLGAYELIRRRCRYIIASDATCDPAYAFEDLGNLIRKSRIDFGVEIVISVANIRPDVANGYTRSHCAVGQVRYPEENGEAAFTGYLLYVKASLTGSESEDLHQYHGAHTDFPHESTADQWFGEAQFESYRKLGEHIMDRILGEAAPVRTRQDLETFMAQVKNYWLPESPVTAAKFAAHAEALQRILYEIRAAPELAFLDVQIVPEWPYLKGEPNARETPPSALWLPADDLALRAGFYLCNRMLQLMESVYLDLRLEEYYDHPDNRGWMNLFRHWSWSGMFRATWAISVSTYGARFQEFCRKHLELAFQPLKAVEVLNYPVVPPAAAPDVVYGEPHLLTCLKTCASLNFVEHQHALQVALDLTKAGVSYVALRILRVDLPSGIPQIEGAVLDFPVAYLLAYQTPEGVWRVGSFRVRDHLRGMGLARPALQAVASKLPALCSPDPAVMDRLFRGDGLRFVHVFGPLFADPGAASLGRGGPGSRGP